MVIGSAANTDLNLGLWPQVHPNILFFLHRVHGLDGADEVAPGLYFQSSLGVEHAITYSAVPCEHLSLIY